MSERTLPPVDLLRQLVYYNPETGILTWRKRDANAMNPKYVDRWNARWAETEISSEDKDGYIVLRRNGCRLLAHRAAWAITYGDWPKNHIDHINGVRNDNRIKNLRDVSRQENNKNSSLRSDNVSGVVGISWDNNKSKWTARIKAGNKYKFLGYFDLKDDAVAARSEAEPLYGYHQNHGKKKGAT